MLCCDADCVLLDKTNIVKIVVIGTNILRLMLFWDAEFVFLKHDKDC